MNEQQAQQAIGQNLYSADGAKIGTVAQVYLDDVTGQPEWATVQTGMFGTKESFVPISQSEFSGEGPYGCSDASVRIALIDLPALITSLRDSGPPA